MNKDNFLQQFQLNSNGWLPPWICRACFYISGEQLRKAVLSVGLVEREDGLHVIFTKREYILSTNSDKLCFPGGKHEQSDPSMQFTALRELHEEVGIRSDQVKIVGQLIALSTISKFSVTPIVAMVDPDYKSGYWSERSCLYFWGSCHLCFDQAKLIATPSTLRKSNTVFLPCPSKSTLYGASSSSNHPILAAACSATNYIATTFCLISVNKNQSFYGTDLLMQFYANVSLVYKSEQPHLSHNKN